jgi:hypothetical protein
MMYGRYLSSPHAFPYILRTQGVPMTVSTLSNLRVLGPRTLEREAIPTQDMVVCRRFSSVLFCVGRGPTTRRFHVLGALICD